MSSGETITVKTEETAAAGGAEAAAGGREWKVR